MKIKRQKRVNRFLSFFKNNYGFREPYQVLVDGTFCQAALIGRMAVREQVTKYLTDGNGNRPPKILTTCCAVVETENLGRALQGASSILKTFPVHLCGHGKSPISGSLCLRSMVSDGNPSRYIIASQDRILRTKLRKVPGIPLMYVHYRGPILEKPSAINESTASDIADTRFSPNEFQVETLKCIKKEVFGDDFDKIEKRKRRKRVRGPNPLSCKPKKIKTNEQKNTDESKSRRRKRVRIKVAKHIREHIDAAAGVSTASSV